jgi:Flp pilus assembly protein TadG
VPDGGAVTAEFAVALPALVLLLGFGLGAIDATLDKLRCVDAARDAALAQARGADGVTAGHARAPAGAAVVVTTSGGVVRVTVTMTSRPLGPHLPGVGITSTAVAAIEPQAGQVGGA